MWLTTLWNEGTPALQWGVVLGAALVAAATDLSARRIPNWLTGPLWLAGLVAAPLMAGLPGFVDGLVASVLLALPYVVLFALARGGAGDAKLMGAIGAWLGTINGAVALAGVAVAGVVLAVVWSMARREGRAVAGNLSGIASGVFLAVCTGGRVSDSFRASASPSTMTVMPYGLAILAGVVLSAAGVLIWHA